MKFTSPEIVVSETQNANKNDIEKITKIAVKKYFRNNDDKKNLGITIKNELENRHIWVRNANVRTVLPNKIFVEIEEFIPFAIERIGGDIVLLDENGSIIKVNRSELSKYYNLIMINGDDARNNVKKLFNILSYDPSIIKEIYEARFIGKRRWDIEFYNQLLVKLPEKNTENTWMEFIKLRESLPKHGVKVVDLRVNNKIFLEKRN